MRRVVAVALCLTSLAVTGAAQGAAVGSVPRYEPVPCPGRVAADEKIECGRLVVPENRAKPGGRTIGVPVVIFRSRAAHPKPDPVLFTSGGPGTSAAANARSGRNISLLDERDYVVLGQRGSKFGEPFLECPEVAEARRAALERGARVEDQTAAEVAAARRCRDRLRASGVDLDGYTTAESAADIEDLRRALGVERWNLYGISYSVRIMLEVIRGYPGTVRSAVLDSALPPDVDYDEVGVTNVARSLDVLFGACAADPDCFEAYPDLRKQFYEVVRRANERPLPVEIERDGRRMVVPVGGPRFVALIADTLAVARAIPRAPRLIAETHAGRYAAIAPLVSESFDNGFVWGLRYSVWCADEMPFADPAKVARQSARDYPELGGYVSPAVWPGVCREWGVRASGAREDTPVTSDVPVLVIAGEYDPATPPSWGRRAVRTLKNGRFVEVPGHGHTPSMMSTGPCVRQIVDAFVRDPSAAPDVTCLSGYGRPKFVPGT